MKLAISISVAMAVYYIFSDVYTPSMPMIAADFQVTRDQVQQTLTYFFAGSALMCLVAGFISERIGKRNIILYGTIISIIGTVLAIFSPTILVLNIARALQGFGGVAGIAIGFALLDEAYSKKAVIKIFSLLGSVSVIVPGIAPVLGGWIAEHFGWRMNFVLLLVLSGVTLFLLLWSLPRTAHSPQKMTLRNIARDYIAVLRHPGYLSLALLYPILANGEWFFLSFLPFYAQNQLHVSPTVYGVAIGYTILSFAAGSYLGGKIASRLSLRSIVYAALGLTLASGAALTILSQFEHTLWMIGVALGFYFLGMGIMFPVTVPAIMDMFQRQKGTASALRYLFVVILSFFGAWMAELANETHLNTLGIYLLATSLLAFFAFAVRPELKK